MASKIKSSRGGVRAGSGRPTSELRKNMVIRIKPSVIEMMAGEKSKSLLIERLVEGYYAALVDEVEAPDLGAPKKSANL